MPTIPKWAAGFLDNAFAGKFRNVTVTAAEYLHPQLKRIRFEGDFSKVKFEAGQAVLFKVDDTNYRNYTPYFFDSKAGICDVLFHLHQRGPGSIFFDNLSVGTVLKMSVPRGHDLYKAGQKYHFFFGDETTLGLFKSLKELINEHDQNYIGVLEMDNGLIDVPEDLGMMIDVVEKSVNPAEKAIHFLQNLDETLWSLWKNGVFYLMGNAKSIQNFRKALKAYGIASKNIVTQPYWAEGKVGL